MSSRQDALHAMHEWAVRASDAEIQRRRRNNSDAEVARCLKDRDEAIRMVEVWGMVVRANDPETLPLIAGEETIGG